MKKKDMILGTRFVRHNPALRKSERERMLVLGAAVMALSLIGIMVFVLNYRSTAAANVTPANSATDNVGGPVLGTVMLLVPETAVSRGTKLSDISLKAVYWPRNQVPAGAIRDAADVKSLYAKRSLPAGLPLTRDNLTTQAPINGLAPAKGFRAVTLRGDAVSLLEGHAVPGNRVDVVLTYLKDGIKTSRIIVQNSKVLSLGGRTAVPTPLGMEVAPQASTITLEVSPQDALEIQTAKAMGRLSLILRPLDDNQSPDQIEVTQHAVQGDRARRRNNRGENCNRGHVRSNGKEYVINCDGAISQVLNSDEP